VAWRSRICSSAGQDTVDYALLIVALAITILLGGFYFGAALHAWLKALLDRITAT
jgi:Flp pilus assembly pilin Flp